MRVLVTGVAGRVGSWLAEELVDSGYQVRGMIRPGGKRLDSALASRIEVAEAGLSDTGAIERVMSDVDVVVHLAAQMPMGDTPVDVYYDINVGGTLRLLEASVMQGSIRRFVYASTDNTYGPAHPQSDLITEEHPQMPGDYYGTSKVLCERLVQNFHMIHGLEYSIVRLGSILTPDEAPPLFRLDWVRSFFGFHAAAGRRSNLWQLFAQCDDPVGLLDATVGRQDGNPAIALTGSRGEPWSVHFTDVRDVVTGLKLAMEHEAAANDEFNILGPRTTTFTEGAAHIAKMFDADMLSVEMPMTLAFELSNAKANRMLGYEPQWTFEQTVRSAATAATP